MAEQIIGQAKDLIATALSLKIPEQVSTAAANSVATSRQAYDGLASVAKDIGTVNQDAASVVQQGLRALVDKAVENAEANTAAAFDAAEQIAKAKSVSELQTLQLELAQKSIAAASGQVREFCELVGVVTKNTGEAVNVAASKALQPVKLS